MPATKKRGARRPSNVPRLAKWTAAKYWTWTDTRTRIGRWWNDRGVVICEWMEDKQGRPHGEMRYYHHNGELASKQAMVHGAIAGTQIGYAPIKRGKPSPFWPRVHLLIRRIERTWKSGKPGNEKFFDAAGRVVDRLGRPLAKAKSARASARSIAKRFVAKRNETFEVALERARRWAAALTEAGHEVPEELVRTTAKPASAAAITKLERAIGTRLPASYVRFLKTIGGVELHEGAVTVPPAALIGRSKQLHATLAEMLRDLTPSETHDVRTMPAPTPWAKWRPASRYLPPEQLLVRSWFVVGQNSHELYVMAPHLDLRGSAPMFLIYTDEALHLTLVGSFDTWVSQAIDRVIAEVTAALS